MKVKRASELDAERRKSFGREVKDIETQVSILGGRIGVIEDMLDRLLETLEKHDIKVEYDLSSDIQTKALTEGGKDASKEGKVGQGGESEYIEVGP